jgi:hypothetical protein
MNPENQLMLLEIQNLFADQAIAIHKHFNDQRDLLEKHLSVIENANTTGIGRFAECPSPNCIRQRLLGKKIIGKAVFVECFLSGTRQSVLPSARHSVKFKPKKTRKN